MVGCALGGGLGCGLECKVMVSDVSMWVTVLKC